MATSLTTGATVGLALTLGATAFPISGPMVTWVNSFGAYFLAYSKMDLGVRAITAASISSSGRTRPKWYQSLAIEAALVMELSSCMSRALFKPTRTWSTSSLVMPSVIRAISRFTEARVRGARSLVVPA